ncbi:hypothetical protein pdam_00025591, partial [Pocillopora damicornis]
MVVTSPTTESAPVPEGYGTTPDHIILQPDKTDASGLLKAITDFDFIVTFICAYSCLSHMSGLTVKLQKKTNDIFKAFSMVTEPQESQKDSDTVPMLQLLTQKSTIGSMSQCLSLITSFQNWMTSSQA